MDDDPFLDAWLAAADEHDIRDTLLREERSITLNLDRGSPAAEWIGRPVRELERGRVR